MRVENNMQKIEKRNKQRRFFFKRIQLNLAKEKTDTSRCSLSSKRVFYRRRSGSNKKHRKIQRKHRKPSSKSHF